MVILDINCLQQFLTYCSVGCLGAFLTPQLYIFNCPNTHHPSGRIFVAIWWIFPGHLSRWPARLSPSGPCIIFEQKCLHILMKSREETCGVKIFAKKYLVTYISLKYLVTYICKDFAILLHINKCEATFSRSCNCTNPKSFLQVF